MAQPMVLRATKMSNKRHLWWAGAVILLSLALQPVIGRTQAGVAAQSQTPHNIAPAPPSLPISYGDLIEVTVFDNPELSSAVRVNSNGEVVLPLGGAVKVKGLTAAEAGEAIAAELRRSGILLDPHVTVMIVEYQSQGVTVTGEVRSPGVYPMLANRTVLDMIALAGGLNENAGEGCDGVPPRRSK